MCCCRLRSAAQSSLSNCSFVSNDVAAAACGLASPQTLARQSKFRPRHPSKSGACCNAATVAPWAQWLQSNGISGTSTAGRSVAGPLTSALRMTAQTESSSTKQLSRRGRCVPARRNMSPTSPFSVVGAAGSMPYSGAASQSRRRCTSASSCAAVASSTAALASARSAAAHWRKKSSRCDAISCCAVLIPTARVLRYGSSISFFRPPSSLKRARSDTNKSCDDVATASREELAIAPRLLFVAPEQPPSLLPSPMASLHSRCGWPPCGARMPHKTSITAFSSSELRKAPAALASLRAKRSEYSFSRTRKRCTACAKLSLSPARLVSASRETRAAPHCSASATRATIISLRSRSEAIAASEVNNEVRGSL
mmetsp:Transcript_73658/g.204800  ORF Transcript_73658/g.204800 Transcript_73658/m.204800 type:complete len:368 (+) Transcript_73658:282-1385(+)